MSTPQNNGLTGTVRHRVLDMIENDTIVMQMVLAGHDRKSSNDFQLAQLTTGVGDLAAWLKLPVATQQAAGGRDAVTGTQPGHHLKCIYGFSVGWILALSTVKTTVAEVTREINGERDRQEKLRSDGRFPWTCSSRLVQPIRKLRVLVEEVGEVADALESIECARLHSGVNRRFDAHQHLIDELIQVAAVTVAWLESMEVTPKGAKA